MSKGEWSVGEDAGGIMHVVARKEEPHSFKIWVCARVWYLFILKLKFGARMRVCFELWVSEAILIIWEVVLGDWDSKEQAWPCFWIKFGNQKNLAYLIE